jgi:hypothetical protein
MYNFFLNYPARGVRHCEGEARSNPVIYSFTLDCFASLAMTKRRIIPCAV